MKQRKICESLRPPRDSQLTSLRNKAKAEKCKKTSQLRADREACPEAHLPFILFQEFSKQLVTTMDQLLGIPSLLTLLWLAECLCLSVEFYCPPVVKPEITGMPQAPEFKILPEKTSCTHKAIHSLRLVGASSPVTWIQGSLEHSGCSNPK